MGIIADARTDLRALLAQRYATLPRGQRRKYLAALGDGINELLAKRDAQDTGAAAGFAATRQAQFDTYVAALPDVTLGVDPTEG